MRIPEYDMPVASTRATVGWPTLAGFARVGLGLSLFPCHTVSNASPADKTFTSLPSIAASEENFSHLLEARILRWKFWVKFAARFGFLLVGYVIMPDHMRLLISEPPASTPSQAMQVFRRKLLGRKRKQKGQSCFTFSEEIEQPLRF